VILVNKGFNYIDKELYKMLCLRVFSVIVMFSFLLTDVHF